MKQPDTPLKQIWLGKAGRLLLALVVFALFLSLLDQSAWVATRLHHYDGTLDHQEHDWTLSVGGMRSWRSTWSCPISSAWNWRPPTP